MEFLCKISGIFSLAAFLVSCSAGSVETGRNVIGTDLPQKDAPTMQVYEDEDTGKSYFYSYDASGRRINFVDPNTKALNFSPQLSGSDHAWLATTLDGYAFEVAAGTVTLRTNKLQTATTALKLTGKIISSTTDFTQGYMVFVDEFFSIGILQLNTAGEVTATWTGGPIVDGISSVTAGEMIDDAQLVLVVNGGKVLVVDLPNSVSAKAWKFKELNLGLSSPNWVGRIEGRNDRAMILDGSRVHLLDLANGVILDTATTRGGNVASKFGEDHVFYFDSSSGNLTFIRADSADSLGEHQLKLVDSSPVYTQLSADNLVMATDDNVIVKYRLSDGLVLSKNQFTAGEARIGISADYAVAMFESSLGYVEILDLNSGEKSAFKAFNLPVLQGK